MMMDEPMFQTKICGITSVEDALIVARAGADAIGLNFYAHSPRGVTPATAANIVQILPAGISKVGLFVDTPADEICRLFDHLRLDLIQLHGDQPPEFLTQLGPRPVMRAFRVGTEKLRPVAGYLDRCRGLGQDLELVLLDSLVAGEYGGTGTLADWSVAQAYLAEIGTPPLVLAGGLTPENVAAAIRSVRPAAVDVASGVESHPGRKAPARVEAFVQAARMAFGRQGNPQD
jgi:phosphoribosylanthranilate isomerase